MQMSPPTRRATRRVRTLLPLGRTGPSILVTPPPCDEVGIVLSTSPQRGRSFVHGISPAFLPMPHKHLISHAMWEVLPLYELMLRESLFHLSGRQGAEPDV